VRRRLWLPLLGVLFATAPAAAQDYPTRPIRLIVAFSAGGTTDFVARLIADKVKGTLGQPVVVENKPGANGAIGADFVSKFAAQFADAADYFDEARSGEEPNPLQWLNMMPPGHQPPPKGVHLDLRKANRSQLLAAGLRPRSIFTSDLCTACRTDLFFSFRKEGALSGRLMSVIGIRQK